MPVKVNRKLNVLYLFSNCLVLLHTINQCTIFSTQKLFLFLCCLNTAIDVLSDVISVYFLYPALYHKQMPIACVPMSGQSERFNSPLSHLCDVGNSFSVQGQMQQMHSKHVFYMNAFFFSGDSTFSVVLFTVCVICMSEVFPPKFL